MKLLFLDIETAPTIATVWGLFDQNIALNQISKPGYTLCWAAKWHKEPEMHYRSVLDGRTTMVRQIHRLMCKADAICHYNGNKFDIPTLNKEFLLLGLKPPAPSSQVDLYQTVKTRFRFESNKLEYVARRLEIGNKLQHKGHELWMDCMAKNRESFAIMERYNKQDVALIERLYDKLLPWITRHPNLSAELDAFCCPKCSSRNYQQRGYNIKLAYKYRRYQCKDCGAWFSLNLREKAQKTRAMPTL